MDITQQARDKLKTLLKPEFHHYIDTQLAGDFAFALVKTLEENRLFRPDWTNYRQGVADGVSESRELLTRASDLFTHGGFIIEAQNPDGSIDKGMQQQCLAWIEDVDALLAKTEPKP